MVAPPVARVFGQMQRQRPVRAEQAEEMHQQPVRLPVGAGLPAGQRRRCEHDGRVLAEPHRDPAPAACCGRSRAVAEPCLQAAHRLIEAPRPRRLADPRREPRGQLGRARRRRRRPPRRAGRSYACARWPMRAGQRITSPRSGLRSTVSVNPLIETYLARNRSSTAASTIPPEPPNGASSMVSVISSPRPAATGPAPGMRRTIGCATTERQPLQLACGDRGAGGNIEPQQLAQRRRTLHIVGVDEAQVVQRQMADEAPGIFAVAAAGARVGRADQAAHRRDRRADRDREVGVLLAHRHRERQVAVGAHQVEAKLAQIVAGSAPVPASTSEMNTSWPR